MVERRLANSESKWSFKCCMMNSGGKQVGYQERRSAWCGVRGGQGECWWWWRSAEWNWRAQIQAKKRRRGLISAYPAKQPIYAEQRQKGRKAKSLEWNRGAPNQGWGGDWGASVPEDVLGQKKQYGALNKLSKHQSKLHSAKVNQEVPIHTEDHQRQLWSANRDWAAPMGIEEYLLYQMSTMGGRVVWSSPTMCNWWVQWCQQ